MKDIVFFCQAPADIVHILKEYDDLKTKYADDLQVEIVCVNQRVLLDYFNNIQLNNVRISYLKYIPISLKKIWQLWNWKQKTIKSIEKLGFLSGDKTFYFCSIYDDAITLYLMKFFHDRNKEIIYLNHYDNKQNISPLEKRNIKQKIYEILFFIITGIKYKFWNMSGRWGVLRFPIENVDFQEKYPVLDTITCEKYAYKIMINKSEEAVIVFSQPNRERQLLTDEEYDNLHIQIVLKLKEIGYKVYAKGHPRIGLCECIKNLVDEEIPQIVPSELLDLSMFKFCIGFATIAMASSAKLGIPTYSFLPLVKDHSSSYEELMKFSIISGDKRVKFIYSLDEIAEI
jgi:hypothetical protein